MDWHKSSFSGEGGNCVQVRQDLTAVRDSMNPAAVLPVALCGLLIAFKDGLPDRRRHASATMDSFVPADVTKMLTRLDHIALPTTESQTRPRSILKEA